ANIPKELNIKTWSYFQFHTFKALVKLVMDCINQIFHCRLNADTNTYVNLSIFSIHRFSERQIFLLGIKIPNGSLYSSFCHAIAFDWRKEFIDIIRMNYFIFSKNIN